MAKPVVVFVPGFWEGVSVFDSVKTDLETEHGYSTLAVPLTSTGTASPGNPSLKDDVGGIRSAIEPLVHDGKELLLVLHSAGGFLGAEAIRGLSVKEQLREGNQGGVKMIVFLSAGIWREGFHHQPLPCFEYDDNRMYCKDPRSNLLHDLPDFEAEAWLKKFECQPAFEWDDVIDYGGWKNVPSVYLCCLNDALLPLELQQQMAALAGSEIQTCSAGHMVMLSQPDRVVEVIRKAAGEAL